MNDFDWDDENASHIWSRYRIETWEAEEVFDDPFSFTYAGPAPGDERRVLVGITLSGRQLAVAYALRDNVVRVVQARTANQWERKRYGDSVRRK